ncbi:Ldh family oxidoreductase [Nonomuraea sp. K274]|uniref:Ldh family oxidoreductase n=1 Tax=Nonomuraea cypriaca TaxID=1187855 RepID=A0A931A6I9_9ACTN|nr:Ldh family oxidoreductase [Nonomuraea cypriaca]
MLSFGGKVLVQTDVPEKDAHLLAHSLVQADLWGHPSHGTLRLPWYVERLRTGAMSATTDPTVVIDTGSLLVLDGRDGIGQVLTDRAVTLGTERAKAHGISGVAVRNSNHFGMAAYFTRKSADAGCIGLLVSNASPAMAPWGGRRKSIGTNPWSIAAPAGRYGVAVIDLANTAVARGKLYLAAERGQAIPYGWAVDAAGADTNDPQAGIEGLILPMAGAKGYVIAFMMDVLAGVLTGSGFGDSVVGPYDPDRPSGCGHLLMTIDVAALTTLTEFEARMETLIDATKAVDKAAGTEEIFFPGELEARAAQRRTAEGIPITDSTWARLTALAEQTGTALPHAVAAEGTQ